MTLLKYPNVQAQVYRMTVNNYHKLVEQGVLSKKTELIDGILIDKTPESPKHTYIINAISKILRKIFEQNGFYIQIEQPITTRKSEPEPDVSIICGDLSEYKLSHPTTARLVVEVSITTYDLDFQKQFIYADANVPEYWLINLKDMEVEVYKNPDAGKYLEKKIYRPTDSIEIEGTIIELKEFLA
ncbi:MAG: Uma2 family endonuclease [Leptospiraceae bacterium]|nr:Uma2 family endonuclease [Leptospiraceae bacterium]